MRNPVRGFRMRVGWVLVLLSSAMVWPGCPTFEGSRPVLSSADPVERMEALVGLEESADEESVPGLIDALADPNAVVRAYAATALRQRTGQDLGYEATDPASKRSGAIKRWRAWWEERASRGASAGDPREG